MILETGKYYPALLKTIKDTVEYNNAAWLLQYHIESMLDIYKRYLDKKYKMKGTVDVLDDEEVHIFFTCI